MYKLVNGVRILMTLEEEKAFLDLSKKTEKPLEELKQEKIQELKNNCQKYIYSKYPIYKQINAANGLATEEEISQMITFIQQTRLICEEKEQQIKYLSTKKELEKININLSTHP